MISLLKIRSGNARKKKNSRESFKNIYKLVWPFISGDATILLCPCDASRDGRAGPRDCQLAHYHEPFFSRTCHISPRQRQNVNGEARGLVFTYIYVGIIKTARSLFGRVLGSCRFEVAQLLNRKSILVLSNKIVYQRYCSEPLFFFWTEFNFYRYGSDYILPFFRLVWPLLDFESLNIYCLRLWVVN